MSKFKFITLAASIMLALAFTISCSDDKDEPTPTPPSVDGSLDGTWQLGNATLEIDGAFFSIEDPEDPSGKFGGPISYDGSRITLTANSYWNGSWQQLPPNLVNTGTISYMLSSNGNTLTISGFPPRDDKYNGAWTKIPDAPQPPSTGGGSDWDGTWLIEDAPYKIQFSGNEFFFQINGIAVVKGTAAFTPTHISMNGTHYISSSEININPPQWHPYSAVNFWKLEFDYAKNADGSVNIINFVSNNTKDGEEELPDTRLIKDNGVSMGVEPVGTPGDGSLDGTWSKTPGVFELNAAEFTYKENGVNMFKGTVNYDGSNISFSINYVWNGGQWGNIPTNTVRANYTLNSNGNTLTFSGFTGEDAELNGNWTNIQ